MTETDQPQQMREIKLPQPQPPIVTRVLSDNLAAAAGGDPLLWVVGAAHPMDKQSKVVRMFVYERVVHVYTSREGNCVRNVIPLARVRLVEEVMPVEMFVEELQAAEDGEDPDDDGDDEDDEELDLPDTEPPPGIPVSSASNGQASS